MVIAVFILVLARIMKNFSYCPHKLILLFCAMLMAGGCGGGGGGGGGGSPPPPNGGEPPPPGGGFPPDVNLPLPPIVSLPTVSSAPAPTFRSNSFADALNPLDPQYSRAADFGINYALNNINADGAYRRGYFGSGAVIAVIDDGMDTTHPDLAGRIVKPRNIRGGNAHVTEADERNAHGTFVAMIAAGQRGNTAGNFAVQLDNGAPIPTKNVHGVAPEAMVMPIQLRGNVRPEAGIEYAAREGAHILNASIGLGNGYFGKYAGRDGVWYGLGLPYFLPLLQDSRYEENFRSLLFDSNNAEEAGAFKRTEDAVRNTDLVMVWAAGNSSWNSGNPRARRDPIFLCGKNRIDEEGCPLGQQALNHKDFMENFSWLPFVNQPDHLVSFKDMWGTACGRDNCIEYSHPDVWGLSPHLYPGILGKLLVVGAVDENDELTYWSNGCGAARNWCLVAPGVDLAIKRDIVSFQGTSFSAPYVSGALAVLKSRFPSMSMETISALLLVSADPLGSRVSNRNQPDANYGWGRLNLGNAIEMQGSIRIPALGASATTQSAFLRDARITLPSALSHVRERLQGVSLAAGPIGQAYFNMRLSQAIDIESERAPVLGQAAEDMLAPSGDYRLGTRGLYAAIDRKSREVRTIGLNISADLLGRWQLQHNLCDGCQSSIWREWAGSEAGSEGEGAFTPPPAAPFFASQAGEFALQMQGGGVRPFAVVGGRGSNQTPWRQHGLRYLHERGGFGFAAEFSRVDEPRSFWGADFGALGRTHTETRQSRLLLSAPLAGDWRGFASYEHSAGKVSASGGMLTGISAVRASGWSSGIQGHSVFRDDDALRFSARRETTIRSGRASFDHLVASGSSFVDAFYRGRSQHLERQQTSISLRAEPVMRYALGYRLPVGKRTRFAFGLEYESETHNRGISAKWQMEF